MGFPQISTGTAFLLICVLLVLPSPVAAFGAGNIPSISTVEGQNFRHGDIEDMLKTIAFIKGHKWTSMMVKRVYFGNWLRDYSQAVDVGSLKGVNAATIRILVWVLSFLSFGYATEEFEVTEERLGVYRPEEHIDNPKDYADNKDAREFDRRLRGPVHPRELDIDPNTALKNYISNESGGWATSSGYVKFSFARSIHFGRLYTNGTGNAGGREADLCEALRCLGQGLHCLEDYGAHTNYVELSLRELGYREVYPHCGTATEINVHGHHIFPLVTGTFGAVDFLHSVLGEATDHFTQTEIEEMDLALLGAEKSEATGANSQRGLFGRGDNDFASLLGQVPGLGGGLAATARDLQTQSATQEYQNSTSRGKVNTQFQGPPTNGNSIPGMSPDFDPVKTAKQIYPILEFRDKVVRAISATIAKIPGLESLVEKIGETLTVFVLSLLAPFVRPIIDAVSKSLKEGSTGVVEASANSQFEPWHDPHCTNPTHSMLSKDHFSNKLNGVAGRVAATILQYVTPRVLYAWENPGVSVEDVMKDIMNVFHHPALRNEHLEVHRNMFNTVKKWVEEQPDRNQLNHVLGSASVKAGRNHAGGGGNKDKHDHGALGGHGKTSGSIWSEIKTRDLGALGGEDSKPHTSYLSSPQPGSPIFQSHQDYGYENRPGSAYKPTAQNNYQNPIHQSGGYQGRPPQTEYTGYGQEPASFGMPPGPPEFQQPPYPNEPLNDPPYPGGQGRFSQDYQQGPPGGFQGGYQQGPPGGYQGGYQQGPPGEYSGGYQQGPPGGFPGGHQQGPPRPNWQQGSPQGNPGYPGGPQGPYPGQGGGYGGY